LYFGRFSSVHIGDTSANQATSFEIQLIQSIQESFETDTNGLNAGACRASPVLRLKQA